MDEVVIAVVVAGAGVAGAGATAVAAARTRQQEQKYSQGIAEGGTSGGIPAQYHGQVLSQSNMSFNFALAAASIGMSLIVAAVVLLLAGTIDAGVATAVVGVLSEGVAALFFRESRESRGLMAQQMDALNIRQEQHDRDQLTLSYVMQIQDPKLRDRAILENTRAISERPILSAPTAPKPRELPPSST